MARALAAPPAPPSRIEDFNAKIGCSSDGQEPSRLKLSLIIASGTKSLTLALRQAIQQPVRDALRVVAVLRVSPVRAFRRPLRDSRTAPSGDSCHSRIGAIISDRDSRTDRAPSSDRGIIRVATKPPLMMRTVCIVLCIYSAIASNVAAATILPNDNTHPAGHLARGVLTVRLELRVAEWRPESNRPLTIPIFAFAEEGRPAEDPGPLIRVEEGTEIDATVSNQLPVAAAVHGFHSRPGKIDDAVVLAPGERREIRFVAGTPGTYFYWADTRKTNYPPPIRLEEDTELAGAFIVDARGTTLDDRVFVINLWLTKFLEPGFREQLAVNGRSWPDSERLTVTQGKPVRWRIINPTISDHAMHLHGFFYTITGVGDSERFERYAPGFERQVVTEHIDTGQTFDMTWVPDRAGN